MQLNLSIKNLMLVTIKISMFVCVACPLLSIRPWSQALIYDAFLMSHDLILRSHRHVKRASKARKAARYLATYTQEHASEHELATRNNGRILLVIKRMVEMV